MSRPGPDRERGSSLVEVVVALGILAFVMTSAAVFFLNSLQHASLQVQRQAAVSIADQGIEAVRAVQPNRLLAGRSQADVAALLATPGAAALTVQDVVDRDNFDLTALPGTTPTVPLTRTQTVDGEAYTVRTFIDVCYLDSGAGTCTRTAPSGAVPVLRATVSASWVASSDATCATGSSCSFATSTLVDRQGDPSFNSNISSPVISDVTPAPVLVGSTRELTVTGVDFGAGAFVTIGSGGGTVGAVSANQGTSLKVTLTAGTTPGSYLLSVVNPDGGRATSTLTLSPPPTLTSVSPATLVNDATTTLSLTGTGLQSGLTVALSGGTVSSATWTSATAVSAVVTRTAGPGTATVTVTNPDGGTASLPLTATASTPAITSGSQTGTVAEVGLETQVTLTGTAFSPSATVTVPAGQGTVTGYVSRTTTSLVLRFTTVAASASPTFTLTNPDGGTTSRAVAVAAGPVVTGSSQSGTGPVGTTISVTLTGSGFSATSGTVTASAGTVGAISSRSATSYTFSYTPASVNPSVTFTLTNPTGGSGARTVAVATLTPAITGSSQGANRPVLGQPTTITLTGTGFAAGTAVVSSPSGMVSSYSARTSTTITFDWWPTSAGSTTFTVTNPDTASGSRAVVVYVTPTFNSFTTSSTKASSVAVITVYGTGVVNGPTQPKLLLTINGGYRAPVGASSSTATSATFYILNETVGTYYITAQLQNPDGLTSNTFTTYYTVDP